MLLAGILGLALGHLCATAIGVKIAPEFRAAPETESVRPVRTRQAPLSDYNVILQKNIFDSSGRSATRTLTPSRQAATTPGTSDPQPAVRADLTLLGTVVAGEESLALIQANKQTEVYHLGEEVPGGGKISKIERQFVHIRNTDGTTEVLPLYGDEQTKRTTTAPKQTGSNIREVGENRWVIPREEAQTARTNLSALLKSARMEPRLVQGQTQGFVVKMIRPRSLLAKLGIRKGDVILEINGMKLDGPEKALQIFQQLREARNISLGLERRGELLNFEYEVD